MSRSLALVLVVAIAAGAALTGWGLVTAGPGGCPTALLQGTLAERDGTLGVAPIPADGSGRVVRVEWPFGYGVATDADGTLTLTRVFQPVARLGDPVSVGGAAWAGDPAAAGGDHADWLGCGPVEVGLLVPPPEE